MSNFDGHKFAKTSVEALTKLGLNVGSKVIVNKRFTAPSVGVLSESKGMRTGIAWRRAD